MRINLGSCYTLLILLLFAMNSCSNAEPTEPACEPSFLILSTKAADYPRDEITGRHLNTLVSGQIAVIGCRAHLARFKPADIEVARKKFQVLMESHGFGFLLGAKVPSYRKKVAAEISAGGDVPPFSDFFMFYYSYGEQF